MNVFFLCNKGKVASLSLFFCHHSGVLLTVKVLLVEMNMHWAVTVSTWPSGQSGPLYLWRIWPPLLDIAYSSSYAILNIEVYNIGYIFFHFWNSRWVAWIRRCLQDIAKKYWVVDGRNINFGWHIPLNAAEPSKHYMVQELLYMLPCLRWKFQLSAESQRCLS